MTVIRYPLELNENNNDYVSFTHFKYRTNRQITSGSSQVGFFEDDLGQDFEPPPESGSNTVHLYMPNSTPGMSSGQSWADQNLRGPLGQVQLDLVSAAMNTGRGVINSATSGEDLTAKVNQISENLGQGVGEVLRSAMTKGGAAVEQYIVDELSGSFLGNQNAFLSLNEGRIYNSNIEVIYNGPNLRSFTMTFLMMPKTSEEALAITQIIKEFKVWSSPRENGNYYELPHVWRVEYKSPLNNYMNVFKRSVLTNVNVQQNPGQTTHMTFDDGHPISTAMTLSFKEIDVITRDDQINARGIGF